jgi:hypothetical protein
LLKEAEVSSSALFVTLTYAPENCPLTKNKYMTLIKKDIQDFMKRLRKHHKEKLVYYAAGEYGTDTNRPHYHIILFNADMDTVNKAWKLGHIHFGSVTEASVGYCLKYISKTKDVIKHARDDREPEFQLMSKGIGKNYLTNAMRKWHKRDLTNRYYIPLKDGKKIAMPRYYKDKLYTSHQKKIIGATLQQRDTEKWQKMELSTYLKTTNKETLIRINKWRKSQKKVKSTI